ncbi:MAG TPA: hypothetical protein VKU41_30460 [Polyangiaceae bacterium]|nr:hypothetical protein [Polyangiaceae bacterium]
MAEGHSVGPGGGGRGVLRAMIVFAFPFASGCSGIDHGILDNVTPMPDTSILSSGSGQLHTGIAAAFKPRVWTHDLWGTHEQGSSDIGVQTSDGSILHVAPVTNDNRFVMWAVAPGKATLTVTLSGDVAMRVPITVTDPQ